MKTARELYPNHSQWYDEQYDTEPCFETISDYQPILDSFGEILVQVDDHDYQGDSRVLYSFPSGSIGILIFGWGSCSGCDALQNCTSYDEVDELIRDLYSSIRLYTTPEKALEYFKTERLHDGTLYDSTGYIKIFFRKCRQILMRMMKND